MPLFIIFVNHFMKSSPKYFIVSISGAFILPCLSNIMRNDCYVIYTLSLIYDYVSMLTLYTSHLSCAVSFFLGINQKQPDTSLCAPAHPSLYLNTSLLMFTFPASLPWRNMVAATRDVYIDAFHTRIHKQCVFSL